MDDGLNRSDRGRSGERAWAALRVLAVGFLLVVPMGILATIASVAEAGSQPTMLPAGYLSTRGNQIIDSHGNPVRIASVGGLGTVVWGPHLDYEDGGHPFKGLDANIAAMKRIGFNCIRVNFNDKVLDDPVLMSDYDALVAACAKYGLKVILCHHNNEATPANWNNAAQQRNGLWFDKGPGSDGTDDGGEIGTITQEKFLQNWVRVAKRYAGNSTVIGFDLDNEPVARTANGENWGEGGPTDIWMMYTTVGNAIQAVDPGALIVVESPGAPVLAKPIVLNIPHKVLYSVHEYPGEISGNMNDHGPKYIASMNKSWGYLESENIAPVWVGEMGCSANSQDGIDWAKTLIPYIDGTASGGPRFSGKDQPISTDWWAWGCATGEAPDGCLNEQGQVRPEQAPFIDGLFFRARLGK